MSTGTASIVIQRPPDEVWAAIADITRMGEWSPECIAGRWVGGADGRTVGTSFEGDNVVIVAGRTVKRWTTTSKITACEPGHVFEFISEGMTTWRYQLDGTATGTTVTESFSYVPKGVTGFVYERVLRRPKSMTTGMERTLARLKSALESK